MAPLMYHLSKLYVGIYNCLFTGRVEVLVKSNKIGDCIPSKTLLKNKFNEEFTTAEQSVQICLDYFLKKFKCHSHSSFALGEPYVQPGHLTLTMQALQH